MIEHFLQSCRYMIGSLKPFIYIIPKSSLFQYTVDSANSYVNSIKADMIYKVNGVSVKADVEESLDTRLKFNSTVTINIDEKDLKNLRRTLDKVIQGNYYVIVEDLLGNRFIQSPEYASKAGYKLSLNNSNFTENYCTITFSNSSNLPFMQVTSHLGNYTELTGTECNYQGSNVNKLSLNELNYTKVGLSDAGEIKDVRTTNDGFKRVEFIKQTFSYEEEYDGKITYTIKYNLPLSNYKSYWPYSLSKFKLNKYIAIFQGENGNKYSVGGEFGLEPSYSITTGESAGVLNTVNIKLVGSGNSGFGWSSDNELDIETGTIEGGGVIPDINNGGKSTTICMGDYAVYTLLRKTDALGNPIDEWLALEGYKYPNLNVVGTYTLDTVFPFPIKFYSSECSKVNPGGGDEPKPGDKDFYVLPKEMNVGAKGSCYNFSVNGDNLYYQKSSEEIYLDISNSRFCLPDNNSTETKTYTITVRDDKKHSGTITIRQEGLMERWVDSTEKICVGADSYVKQKRYTSLDKGRSWKDTGESRAGRLIAKDSNFCRKVEYKWFNLGKKEEPTIKCVLNREYHVMEEYLSTDNGKTWVSSGKTKEVLISNNSETCIDKNCAWQPWNGVSTRCSGGKKYELLFLKCKGQDVGVSKLGKELDNSDGECKPVITNWRYTGNYICRGTDKVRLYNLYECQTITVDGEERLSCKDTGITSTTKNGTEEEVIMERNSIDCGYNPDDDKKPIYRWVEDTGYICREDNGEPDPGTPIPTPDPGSQGCRWQDVWVKEPYMFYGHGFKNKTLTYIPDICDGEDLNGAGLFKGLQNLIAAPGFYYRKQDVYNDRYFNFASMYENCLSLTSISEDLGKGNLNDPRREYVDAVSFKRAFYNCRKLVNIDLKGLKVSKITEKSDSMAEMFYGCTALEEVDLSYWNIDLSYMPPITFTNKMFYGCRNMKRLIVKGWNKNDTNTFTFVMYLRQLIMNANGKKEIEIIWQ